MAAAGVGVWVVAEWASAGARRETGLMRVKQEEAGRWSRGRGGGGAWRLQHETSGSCTWAARGLREKQGAATSLLSLYQGVRETSTGRLVLSMAHKYGTWPRTQSLRTAGPPTITAFTFEAGLEPHPLLIFSLRPLAPRGMGYGVVADGLKSEGRGRRWKRGQVRGEQKLKSPLSHLPAYLPWPPGVGGVVRPPGVLHGAQAGGQGRVAGAALGARRQLLHAHGHQHPARVQQGRRVHR